MMDTQAKILLQALKDLRAAEMSGDLDKLTRAQERADNAIRSAEAEYA